MHGNARTAVVLIAVALGVVSLAGAAEDAKAGWGPLQFLVGDWVGEGGGAAGQGAGGFSFHPDLQGRILVRKNFAEYPATKERGAFRHDDLTIVYRESDGGPLRAIYFDNEGHVIRYAITASPEGNAVQFLSEATPSAPRYRLTYTRSDADAVGIGFEIAPPGKPDAFTPYIEAKAKRKQLAGDPPRR